ncbi:acyltransferase [Nonomuraea sp. MCN248]|uniref:Acyltransferase n=1 Tax=Nonomuraea corallina TaxID=2989783 RepID=A0ABT4SB29_9ACTN|nr:acyltransferase [Nonomuraea corallina]MDA0634411.1 acyltransferase [Nonomuraea corallina]
MRALRRISKLAEETPAHRDRQADLLRAAAIVTVITGHWLSVYVTYDGGFEGGSVLDVAPWTRWLTWLFQVMPIFFLVGGFAGAASFTSHRSRGGTAVTWVLGRTDRLVRPTTCLLAVLAAGAVTARAAGVDPGLIGTAVWLAAIPLWFLVAYLAVVSLTPFMYGLHRRYGLYVPILLTVLVGVGDAARLSTGVSRAGYASFLLAWLAVYQLGFSWQDGRLTARRGTGPALALGGFAALVALTVAGPYPISMVAAAGEEMQNTSPPTLALLALAAAQTGLALWVREPANRWLRRSRPWTVVVAVNSVIMTAFLWHMTAALFGVLALYPTGVLPEPPPGSPAWLAWRVPWLLVLALFLAVLVAVFGPVEQRAGPRPDPRRSPVVAACAGMAGVVAGLLAAAVGGPGDHGLTGLPVPALAAYFAGAAILRYARSH